MAQLPQGLPKKAPFCATTRCGQSVSLEAASRRSAEQSERGRYFFFAFFAVFFAFFALFFAFFAAMMTFPFSALADPFFFCLLLLFDWCCLDAGLALRDRGLVEPAAAATFAGPPTPLPTRGREDRVLARGRGTASR